MRSLAAALLFTTAALAQSTSFRITPSIITRCDSAGRGRATLSWSVPAASSVQVRLLSPTGPPMSGFEPPQSSVTTGDWVPNGLLFFLVDSAGRELARTQARVSCNGPSSPVSRALDGDYLPLELGNTWVYRTDSRFLTSGYTTWRVTAVESIDGITWFAISIGDRAESGPPAATDMRVRIDSASRVLRRVLAGNGVFQEDVWLDPTSNPSPTATVKVTGRGTFSGIAGDFDNAVFYDLRTLLTDEVGAFVRGLGLARTYRTMLTGSSGGFTDGTELVYAKLSGGRLIFTAPATSLTLSAESHILDVTGHRVTNCAVPCYFAACGFVPGADPPNTYKPCFEVSVKLADGRLSDSTNAAQIVLDLLDSNGQSVARLNQTLRLASLVPETTIFRQLPLYSTPNVPFPPGNYTVRATVRFDSSADSGTSTLAVRIQ